MQPTTFDRFTRRLFLRRAGVAAGGLVAVAAVSHVAGGPATVSVARAAHETVDICHFDEDTQAWELISPDVHAVYKAHGNGRDWFARHPDDFLASDVDFATDVMNCGGCGVACTTDIAGAVPTCADGVCGAACAAGFGFDICDGTCVDLMTDVANCGACGTICDDGDDITVDSCVDGACVFTPTV